MSRYLRQFRKMLDDNILENPGKQGFEVKYFEWYVCLRNNA